MQHQLHDELRLTLDAAIAQSSYLLRPSLDSASLESKRKKWLHFFADLRSQSEFRTQR